MQAVSRAGLQPVAFTGPLGDGSRTTWFGGAAEIDPGPQAYLIEMRDPDSEVAPHFHDVDQFQVVLRGDGRLGGNPLRPFAFHYADAFGPYGPISWTGPGLAWFTLRNIAAHGVWPVEQRDPALARKARNFVGHFDEFAQPLALRTSRTDKRSRNFDDGLGVWSIRLGPQARAPGIASTGGGQYLVVCAGSLLDDGAVWPEGTIILIQAGESAPLLQAGAEGAAVLVLQFPRPSDRAGSGHTSQKALAGGIRIPGLSAPA